MGLSVTFKWRNKNKLYVLHTVYIVYVRDMLSHDFEKTEEYQDLYS